MRSLISSGIIIASLALSGSAFAAEAHVTAHTKVAPAALAAAEEQNDAANAATLQTEINAGM